jgi:hypothetical protein
VCNLFFLDIDIPLERTLFFFPDRLSWIYRDFNYIVLFLEKRIQEIISIILCIILLIYNFFFICRYFDMRNWYLIIPAACMLLKYMFLD